MYAAGDDVRHVDWRTLARTEQLWVRVYREEIAPRVEVLVDASRSMACGVDKAQRTVDLTALLLDLARAGGFQARLVVLGDTAEPVDAAVFHARGLDFGAARPLQGALDDARSWISPGSMRYIVSDFLSPHDAALLTRPIAAGAGLLACVQVLSREDAEPVAGEALRLTDAESGDAEDLVLDAETVRQYRERLRRLMDSLDVECRRARGVFASVRSEEPLERICRDRLLTAGILIPAG
jgi:uncharacterized protein (DUF58 family)